MLGWRRVLTDAGCAAGCNGVEQTVALPSQSASSGPCCSLKLMRSHAHWGTLVGEWAAAVPRCFRWCVHPRAVLDKEVFGPLSVHMMYPVSPVCRRRAGA